MIVRSIDRSAGLAIDATVHFHSFAVQGEAGTSVHSGQLRRVRSRVGDGSRETITADIMIESGAQPIRIGAASLNIVEPPVAGQGLMTGDFSARVYHGARGWFNLGTSAPLGYSVEGYPRLVAGEWGIRSTGPRVEASFINRHFMSVGFDQANSGQVLAAARLDLDAFFGGSPPGLGGMVLAHAGDDIEAALGSTLVLDGRRSHGSSGGMLRFQWHLVAAPPGADARIELVNSPRARLVTNATGPHRVALLVADGQLHARDQVEILVLPANSQATARRGRFGMDRQVTSGSVVRIDARGGETQGWRVFASPAESGATVGPFAMSGPVAQFVADKQGYFVLGPVNAPAHNRVVVNSDQPALFEPRPFAAGYGSGHDATRAIAFADISGDGGRDLVRLVERSAPASGYDLVVQYLEHGNSRVETIGDVSRLGTLAAGDINGDGRVDILVATDQGVFAYLQGPGGAFAAAGPLATASPGCIEPAPRQVFLADLNNDQRLDVVTGPHCGGMIEIHLQQVNGTLAPPVQHAIAAPQETVGRFLLSDYQAQFGGPADLFVVTDVGLRWHPGTGAGGFEPPFEIAMSDCIDIAIGDLGWDGARELVAACAGRLYVFQTSDQGLQARSDWAGVLLPGPVHLHTSVIDDGRLGIVVVQDSGVTVIRSVGLHAFAAPVRVPVLAMPQVLSSDTGDFDRDGQDDLLVIDAEGLKVYFGTAGD